MSVGSWTFGEEGELHIPIFIGQEFWNGRIYDQDQATGESHKCGASNQDRHSFGRTRNNLSNSR